MSKRKYETAAEMELGIARYVAGCRVQGRPLTFTGMASALGFTSRTALYRYEGYEGFEDVVRRARRMVEQSYEERLSTDRGQVAGAIFALKNFGWSDRTEITGAGGGPIKTEEVDAIRQRFVNRVAGIATRVGAGGGVADHSEN